MNLILKKHLVIRAASLVALVACILSGQSAKAITVADSGFELPNLGGTGKDTYFPTGTGWNFIDQSLYTQADPTTGGNGIASNDPDDAAFNLKNATNGNSDGTMSTAGQAAFLNGNIGLSQTLSGFTADDLYTVTFSLESRSGDTGLNPIDVYLGGTLLGPFTPTTTTTFTSFTSIPVLVTSTSAELFFTGTDSTGAYTTFLDNVSVVAAPEPSVVNLLAVAALGVAFLGYRSRSKIA